MGYYVSYYANNGFGPVKNTGTFHTKAQATLFAKGMKVTAPKSAPVVIKSASGNKGPKQVRNPKPAAAIIIGAKHQLKRGIKAAEKLANKIGHSVAVVLAPGGVRRSKRNTEGFKDALGNFHPIRSGDDYDPEDVGERRTYAPAKKKRKATKRKAARRTRY